MLPRHLAVGMNATLQSATWDAGAGLVVLAIRLVDGARTEDVEVRIAREAATPDGVDHYLRREAKRFMATAAAQVAPDLSGILNRSKTGLELGVEKS